MNPKKLLKLALTTFLLGIVHVGFSQENVQEAEFSYSPSGDGLYFKGTIQYKPRYIGEYLVQVGFKEVLVEGIEFEGKYYNENDIEGYNFPITVNKGNVRVASATVWLRTFGNESSHNTKPAILNVYLQGYMDDLRLTQEEIKFLKGKNIDAKEWLVRFDHISNFRVEGEDNLGDGLEITLKNAIRNQRLQKIVEEKAEEEAKLKEEEEKLREEEEKLREEEESAAQEKLKEEEKRLSSSKASSSSQLKKKEEEDKEEEAEETTTSNSLIDPETHKRMMENDPRYRIESNKLLYQAQGYDSQIARKMANNEQQNYQLRKTGDQVSQAMGDFASVIAKNISDSQNEKVYARWAEEKEIEESHSFIVNKILKSEKTYDIENMTKFYQSNDPWFNGDVSSTVNQLKWLLETYGSRQFLKRIYYYIHFGSMRKGISENEKTFNPYIYIVVDQKIQNVRLAYGRYIIATISETVEKPFEYLTANSYAIEGKRIPYSSFTFDAFYDILEQKSGWMNIKATWPNGAIASGKSVSDYSNSIRALKEKKKFEETYLIPDIPNHTRLVKEKIENGLHLSFSLPSWVRAEVEHLIDAIKISNRGTFNFNEGSFFKAGNNVMLNNKKEIVSNDMVKPEFINKGLLHDKMIFIKSPVVWHNTFSPLTQDSIFYRCLGTKSWTHFTKDFTKNALESSDFPITFSYAYFDSYYYLYLDAINKDYSQVRFSGFYSESHQMSIEATLSRIFGKPNIKEANETKWTGNFGEVLLRKEGEYQFLYLPNRFSQPNNPNQTIEEPVLDKAEISPTYSGGMQAFYAYVKGSLKYPEQAKRENKQGTVYVQFVVEKDGSTSNISVMNSLGSGCDEESIRILANCPNWIPGEQGGKKVRVKMFVPVTFSLK